MGIRDQSLWSVGELGKQLLDSPVQAGTPGPCLAHLLPVHPGEVQAEGQGTGWPALWSLPQGRQPRGRPVAALCQPKRPGSSTSLLRPAGASHRGQGPEVL